MNSQLAYTKDFNNIYNFENDPLATFKMILGKERVEQYEKNKIPMDVICKFFKGMAGSEEDAIRSTLLGYEFNVYIINTLKKMNAKNIKSEVGIKTEAGNTRVDCVATFGAPQKFVRVLPSMKEEPFFIKGENAFENKAVNKLKHKSLRQIKKVKTIYPSTNVLILADTIVKPNMCKELYDDGVYIIRTGVKTDDLINNLLNIQKQIKILN